MQKSISPNMVLLVWTHPILIRPSTHIADESNKRHLWNVPIAINPSKNARSQPFVNPLIQGHCQLSLEDWIKSGRIKFFLPPIRIVPRGCEWVITWLKMTAIYMCFFVRNKKTGERVLCVFCCILTVWHNSLHSAIFLNDVVQKYCISII